MSLKIPTSSIIGGRPTASGLKVDVPILSNILGGSGGSVTATQAQDNRVLLSTVAAMASVAPADSLSSASEAKEDQGKAAVTAKNALEDKNDRARLEEVLARAVKALKDPGTALEAGDAATAAARSIGASVAATAAAASMITGEGKSKASVEAQKRREITLVWVVSTGRGTELLETAAQAANRVEQLGFVPGEDADEITKLKATAEDHEARIAALEAKTP